MPQLLVFKPTEDAYIDGGSFPKMYDNFGGSPYLECGWRKAILLRFRISGLPADSTVESVTLDLINAGGSATGTNYLRELNTRSWTEFGATWGMAVLYNRHWVRHFRRSDWYTGFYSGEDYGGTNISTLASDAQAPIGATFTFVSTAAFTNLLQRYAGTGGKLDLCVPLGCGFKCYSRNSAFPPQLRVTYRLAKPVVSSFAPLSTTSSGTTITISGLNFGTSAAMLENITLVNQGGGDDYDLDNQSWTSSKQISGDVPAAATPGTYKIRVVIDGQAGMSQETFAVNSTLPLVSSISPPQGKPSQPLSLTIIGQNFDAPVTEVTFIGQRNQGERPAAGFTRISSTEIQATPPGNLPVGRYRLRITADGESAVSDVTFSSILGPVVW